jgi:ABC-type sugar transport system permease subunit
MTVAGPIEEAEIQEPAPPEKGRRRRQKISSGEGRLALALIAPTLALLALVVGYPIIKAVYQSLLTDQGLNNATGFFDQGNKWNGVGNYKYWLLQQCPKAGGGTETCPTGLLGSQFWSSVEITLFFALVTVVLETIIGVAFALMMNRAFKGRAIVRAVILIPWAIPTAVTSRLWGVIFDSQGILNHLLGTHYQWTSDQWPARFAIIIADTWKTTPFIALLILAGLQGIPAELYESAKLDGASAWQRFTRVTLPLVKPALAVAVIFRALDALRMYDLPAILTHGAAGTTTMSVLVVKQLLTTKLNSASALSTVTFIIIFAISLLLVRLFNANIVGAQKPAKEAK